jgi:hypothetical protein
MPRDKFPKIQKGLIPLERSPKMIQAIKNAGIDLGITPQQAWQIIAPTPKKFIRTRPGKSGQNWNYVPVRFFEMKLFSIFGLNWKFEIVDTKYTKDEVIVRGRLTIKLNNGNEIVREQFGGSKRKEKVELYNIHKAAVSDAFKRCCLQLGIFADVYAPVLAIEDKEASPEVDWEDIPIVEDDNQNYEQTHNPSNNH